MPIDKLPDDVHPADASGTIGQRVADTTREARAAVANMADAAGRRVENGRVGVAERLDGAASTVRDRADQVPGGPRVQEFAHAAADRLSTTADYLRRSDTARMKADVETMVKNNPGPAMLVAAMFGFLLGRALTRE